MSNHEQNGIATGRTAESLIDQLKDEIDAESLVATYVVRHQEEVEALDQLGINAICIDDPALQRDLPSGPGSRVILVNVPRLPRELVTIVESIDCIVLPPHWKNVGEFTQWQPLSEPDKAERLVRLLSWLQFVRDRIRNLHTQQVAAGRPRIAVFTETDVLAMPAPTWLIDALVPAQSIVVLAGEPNAGKSLVVLDWSLRMARGLSTWQDRAVQPGPVLVLAGEGLRGIGPRIRAWRLANEMANPQHPMLFAALPALTDAGALHQLDTVLAEHRPSLVAVDTLSLGMPGADENDSAAVGTVLRAIGQARDRHGCSWVLVHHLRKPATNRGSGAPTMASVRGSGALGGAADSVLILFREPNGDLVLRTEKQRDAQRAPDVRMTIVPIELPGGGRSVHLVPAAVANDPAAPADPMAELNLGVSAAVAALQKLGGRASQVDLIAKAMGGRLRESRTAVHAAIDRGLIKRTGTDRQRAYVVPECVCSAPPIPPSRDDGRRVRRLPSSGSSGTATGRRGTTDDEIKKLDAPDVDRASIERRASTVDDNMSAKPGGRRPGRTNA